jgi:hypothetical protein
MYSARQELFEDTERQQVCVSDAYDFYEIIAIRANHLSRLGVFPISQTDNLVEILSMVMADRQLSDRIWRLFNRNYRTLVANLLPALDGTQDLDASFTELTEARYLPGPQANAIREGIRGRIWRALFEHLRPTYFQPNHLLAAMTNPLLGDEKSSCNLALLVLTYLYNETRDDVDATGGPAATGISVASVFDAFKGLYPKAVVDVATTLWKLYAREEMEVWSRLIRLQQLTLVEGVPATALVGDNHPSNADNLKRSVDAWANGTGSVNSLPRVRISPAGVEFLDTVVRHYEFQAVLLPPRNRHGTSSLFSEERLLGTDASYRNLMAQVGFLIRRNAESLGHFNRTAFMVPHGLTHEDFLDSDFVLYVGDEQDDSPPATSSPNRTPRLHSVRVATTAIQYLDAFRLTAARLRGEGEDRTEVTNEVLDRIQDLVDMFTTGAIPLDSNLALLEQELQACIDWIRENPVARWDSPVRRARGRELLGRRGRR